ncbi:ClpP/crotonase-like domain-containing protein [Gorgonomyces haynaldii]|nr:ClpP/crotonase-like domain-containing protein [Gorgonomyces haynaldii]
MLFLLVCTVACQTYSLLSSVRQQIGFVPYTPEQRQQVAQAVQNMLSIYVHRQEKISHYSAQFPQIDPIPRAQQLLAQSLTMSDRDFHYANAALFNSLRDFHTTYHMPGPHTCFDFVTGVSFDFGPSQDMINNPLVIVSSFSKIQQVVSLSGPDLQKMAVGDRLLTVNGQPFADYNKQRQFNLSGANDYGALRASLASLSFLSGDFLPVPTADSLVLGMSSTFGVRYNVTLPWVAQQNVQCVAESQGSGQQVLKNAFAQKLSGKQENGLPQQRKGYQRQLDGIRQHFGAKTPVFQVNPTEDPTISWGIYDPDNVNLGILTITAFAPVGGISDNAINTIQNLLLTNLTKTDALVIDIRNNGGGDISMANKIPQLFKNNVRPLNFRAINNPINAAILSRGSEGPLWTQALAGIKPSEVFSPLIPFDTQAEVNTRPIVYNRPVAVLANANCYSACDLLAANFQDNGIGLIFGEDPQTGAGGANVVSYNDFLSIAVLTTPNPFPDVPFSAVMPNARQDFTVAWRQMVRIGANNGKVIEDFGVSADVVVRPGMSDILNSNSKTQWDRIASRLIGKPQVTVASPNTTTTTTPQPDAPFKGFMNFNAGSSLHPSLLTLLMQLIM